MKTALFLLSVCAPSLCHALTTDVREYTCPIGGETFTAEMVTSSYRRGYRLDLKPLGALLAPLPLPVCPANGFVMFKRDFTEAEVEALRPFILSDAYQRLRAENTDYFLLAKILEYQMADDERIAFQYLQASWEAENDPALYQRYLKSALQAYERVAQKSAAGEQDAFTARFLLVELNRLRGEFALAKSKLAHLTEVLTVENEFHQSLLELEAKLLSKHNATPQNAPH